MSAFYLAFLAVILSGLGARDQLTVAGLSRSQGARPGVLVVAVIVVIATAALAGWAAYLIIPLMLPDARVFLGAVALAFAAGESLILTPRPPKGEPTRSLGALAIVLFAHQLTDAARFVIFGMAVAMNAPIPAAGGGALGGIVLLGWAWGVSRHALDARLRMARRAIGVILALVAGYVAMRALDWI